MSGSSRKIVFTPAPGDHELIARAMKRAKYASVSAFVRDAVHEKLERLRAEQMFAAVDRYCNEGVEDTDDLIAAQAADER